MNGSIRKMALRHAAKVAFGSFVVACGGTVAGGEDASSDAKTSNDTGTKTDASTSLDSSLDSSSPADSSTSDGALACTGPVDIDASSITPEVFQCCLGVVEQLTGDAGFSAIDAGEITGDPAVDNCCKVIIADVDSNTGDYSAASPTLYSCCNALGNPIGPACTPWGPPMPPCMPYEWLALPALEAA
jgi:hypothetical protein